MQDRNKFLFLKYEDPAAVLVALQDSRSKERRDGFSLRLLL
jgi:hypothetical protein